MDEINTGILREIVKDQTALGGHWIAVSRLLERLQLGEPLLGVRVRARNALVAIERGDLETAAAELELVDAQLDRLVGPANP